MARFNNAVTLLIVCTSVLVTATARIANAAAPGVTLSYHEPLTSLAFRASDGGAINKLGIGEPVSMSFEAFGQRFDLRLRPNSSLLSPEQRARLAGQDLHVYRGEIVGVADSWVRLVVDRGVPRGAVFNGRELFSIEAPGDSLADGLDGPMIYRFSDLVVQPGQLGCGMDEIQRSGGAAYSSLVGELKTLAAAAGPGATLNLELGAVADFEFSEDFGSGAQAALIDRFSRVDGIFSSELGVQISVTEIDIFTEDNDPFTESTAGDLLTELGSYRSTNPAQRARGLSHLFTGRNLDGTTVGIAFVGALCSNFAGAGLSEGRRGPGTDSLIAAHEIGHNFGASHDGDPGGPCPDTPETFLMAPSINGSNQFSQCSQDSMAAEIQDARRPGGCITDLADIDVAATLDNATLTVLAGADFSYGITLDNNGSEAAPDVTAEIQLPAEIDIQSAEPSAGTCNTGAGVVDCNLGTIPGNGTRNIALTLQATTPGDRAIAVSVDTDTDLNLSNNQVQGTVTVNPAVDLTLDPVDSVRINVDAVTALQLRVSNNSGLAANDLAISISVDAGLRIDEVAFSAGSCDVTGQDIGCDGGQLAPGNSVPLTLTLAGTSVGQQTVDISVSAAEAELNNADNTATATITVQNAASVTNNAGGGGGGAALWSLLLLPWLRRPSGAR